MKRSALVLGCLIECSCVSGNWKCVGAFQSDMAHDLSSHD
jgi:hypothetical protein